MGSEINNQARNTNSETNERIFQRYNRSHSKEAQSRGRSEIHDPAHSRRDVMLSVNKFPNQTDVSRVDEEEDCRIEGNRLRRQFAHRHPGG